jgi:hypothetical protein
VLPAGRSTTVEGVPLGKHNVTLAVTCVGTGYTCKEPVVVAAPGALLNRLPALLPLVSTNAGGGRRSHVDLVIRNKAVPNGGGARTVTYVSTPG